MLLLPLVVGVFLIRFALDGRTSRIALEWRGEAYSTRARADQGGFGAERVGVVSDVRVAMRAAVVEGGQVRKDVAALQPHLDALQIELGGALPSLGRPIGTQESAGALEGGPGTGGLPAAGDPARLGDVDSTPGLSPGETTPELHEGRGD